MCWKRSRVGQADNRFDVNVRDGERAWMTIATEKTERGPTGMRFPLVRCVPLRMERVFPWASTSAAMR
jgi:hypothetical protein